VAPLTRNDSSVGRVATREYSDGPAVQFTLDVRERFERGADDSEKREDEAAERLREILRVGVVGDKDTGGGTRLGRGVVGDRTRE